MTPAVIEQAIAKVGGKIVKCDPVCDGSRHYLVTFSAPEVPASIEGAASLTNLGEDRYRIHFILN